MWQLFSRFTEFGLLASLLCSGLLSPFSFADSSTTRPVTQPAVVVARSPLEIARAYTAACNRGDLNAALPLTNAKTPAQRDFVRSFVTSAAAMARRQEALLTRFGEGAKEEFTFG